MLVERVGREGWAVASEDGMTVAIDTELDDELRLEGRLFDRIHEVNVLRKESGLELTDRIRLWLPDGELVERFASASRPRRSPRSTRRPSPRTGVAAVAASAAARPIRLQPAADERVAAAATRRARARGAARPAAGTRRPRRRAGTARSRRRRACGTSRRPARRASRAQRRPTSRRRSRRRSIHASSISVSSSIRWDATPFAARPRRAGSSSTSCGSRSRATGRSRRASP